MSDDAVAYTYANVGIALDAGTREATAYNYINVGFVGVPSAIGRVLGFSAPSRIAFGYIYANILEYVSGTTRTIHDDTARTIHDDTERTI